MWMALLPLTQALELVDRGSTFRVLSGSRQRASRWTPEYVKLLLSPRHSRGITRFYLLLILCACLERNVHRLEALPRRLEQSGPKHRYQDAGEPLGLVEATASRLLLQAEGVLAVEQAGHEQPAAPAQLPLLRERDHGRLEGHRPTPWRLDPHLELAAFAQRTVDRGDERVPGRG